tara:strand:+ start:64 stop:741 length:678 start_codon:yes stop_codon:yes gene_type:complete
MQNKNMKIWQTLSKTNPNYTRTAPSSYGKRITTIDPMYQIQMMTDLFGPVGIGWKYKVDYKYIDGLVFAEVTIKYFTNEWHEYGPVCSVQNLSKKNGGLDDEAPKKAMTDAMTKAFSHLGMSADVFLGKFDDSKYVEQMKKEFSQPKKNSRSSDTEHDNNHDAVAIEHIKNDMKNAKTIYQLRKLKNYKYRDAFDLAIKKHPAVYKDLNNFYETRETQLNTQGVV